MRASYVARYTVLVALLILISGERANAQTLGSGIRAVYHEQYLPVVNRCAEILRAAKQPMLPLVVRLGWHAMGNYDRNLVPRGGSNGGCIRMLPESADPANNGIELAREVIDPVKTQFTFITFADLYVLAANTALEMMGSLPLYFTPGRVDYRNTDPTPNPQCVPAGRMPRKHIQDDVYPFPASRDYHYKKFKEFGFNIIDASGVVDEVALHESIALMGGHSIGGMHIDRSRNEGNWTTTPFIFNNEYFQVLFDFNWSVTTATDRADLDLQYEENGLVMLPSDLSLKFFPEVGRAVENFAKNETSFKLYFQTAWAKLSGNGVTPAPGSDIVPTPAPPSMSCIPSTLQRVSNETYTCTRELSLSSLSLHWTYSSLDSMLYFAVQSGTTGWLGISFPSIPGAMVPADAVIGSSAGVMPYSVTGRTESTVVPSELARSALKLQGEVMEQVSGMTTIKAAITTTTIDGSGSGLVAINVARDPTETLLRKHKLTEVTSITVDLASGDVTVISSNIKFYRRLHAALMVSAWCYILPGGIIIKRYGKRVFGISDSMKTGVVGMGFRLHVACMLISTVLITAAFAIAVTQLNTGALLEKHEHKNVGYAVYALMAASPLLGLIGPLFTPLPTSKGRNLFSIVHPNIGRVAYIMSVFQCFSGAERLEQGDPDAATQFRYAVVIGLTVTVTTVVLLEFINRFCNIRSRRRNTLFLGSAGPTKISWSDVHEHAGKMDPWLVIDGRVYAISSWLDTHPGGGEVLLQCAGSDATDAFNIIQHSETAREKLEKFFVGEVEDIRMDHAIELTEEIANAMVELDLDEAAILIKEAQAEVPRSMLTAFSSLLENLCTYKPFLPASLTTLENTATNRNAESARPVDRVARLIEASPPTHAVLAFTDIQSSTQLWEACPNGMTVGLAKHNEVMRSVLKDCQGYEVKTIGDAFMVSFKDSFNGLKFGINVQIALTQANWPASLLEHTLCTEVCSKSGHLTWAGPRVRIGLHKGDVEPQANPTTGRIDFFGNTVNKAARVEGVAVGGTVAVTEEFLSGLTQEELSSFGAIDMTPLGKVPLKGVKQLSNITVLLPEILKERKQEVLKNLYAKRAGDKPRDVPASPLSVPLSPTVGSGLTGSVRMSRSPFFSSLATCVTVKVNFAFLKQMSTAGEEINSVFSTIIELANRTEAVVQALYGGMVLLTWNLTKRCSQHSMQACKFATMLSQHGTGKVSHGTVWGDAVNLGITSGVAVYGKVGTETQKSIAMVGSVVELSAKVADFCERVGCYAGVGSIPMLRGVIDEPTVTNHTRILDMWNIGGGETVTVHELETLGLASGMSAWGFMGGTAPEHPTWSKEFKTHVHEALVNKTVESTAKVVKVIDTTLQEMKCGNDKCTLFTSVTCEECGTICKECAKVCVSHKTTRLQDGSPTALVNLKNNLLSLSEGESSLEHFSIGLDLREKPTEGWLGYSQPMHTKSFTRHSSMHSSQISQLAAKYAK